MSNEVEKLEMDANSTLTEWSVELSKRATLEKIQFFPEQIRF